MMAAHLCRPFVHFAQRVTIPVPENERQSGTGAYRWLLMTARDISAGSTPDLLFPEAATLFTVVQQSGCVLSMYYESAAMNPGNISECGHKKAGTP